ncbi:flagellar biosynthesis anti-sigma factor FlgM [Roseimaritima sediminicola]|uniref:flagellar biosynthesis anti-sigma factor FlgM n=1 Tax=Roseimaritima sediminicola TaxID=2662066 RepID=UPI00129850FC|nr:flagellar biosynthesis anti-sigma factor FlgM [Roseimaritima sediminicola]
MQIIGPIRVSANQAAQGTSRISPGQANAAETKRSAAPVDQLDLSSAAQQTRGSAPPEAVAGGGEIRLERVAEIRRAIADGTYETPEKLDAAMSRLLDRLA